MSAKVVRMSPVNRIPVTKTQKSYQFRERDPDPVLLDLRDKILDSGKSIVDISVAAQVSWATINNIMNFKTKRPQNYTVDAILRACGWNRKFTKLNR